MQYTLSMRLFCIFLFLTHFSLVAWGKDLTCPRLLNTVLTNTSYDQPVGLTTELSTSNTIFLGYGSSQFNSTYLEILKNLSPEVQVILIVLKPHRADEHFQLIMQSHPNIRVVIDESSHARLWTRDWVPQKVVRPDGSIEYVSMSYGSTAFASMYLMKTLNFPFYLSYLSGEMGNIETDGKGRLFTTTKIFEDNIKGYQESGDASELESERLRVVDELKKAFSVNEVVVLPTHPADDNVKHVDLLIKYVGPVDGEDTFLVTDSISPEVKLVLDQVSDRVKRLGYRVIRVLEHEKQPNIGAMGFVNSLIFNGTVFMPVYSAGFENDPDVQERLLFLENNARGIYESLGFTVVNVDSFQPIQNGGAVHCLSCTTNL